MVLISLVAVTVASSSVANVTPDGVLEIRSGEMQHRFEIEIADDDAERSRGLMFREYLGPGSGMLFIYPREQMAAFWMKNTYIPLDMLFIANNGTILQIAPETVPHSLETVRSDSPVRAVLEIAGGRAAELGIDVGDTVKLYR